MTALETDRGADRLVQWLDIYEQLSRNPKYFAVFRWVEGRDPAVGCTGFGAVAKTIATSVSIDLFEDLSPEDIKFDKGTDDSPAEVTIDKTRHSVKSSLSPSRGAKALEDTPDVFTPMSLYVAGADDTWLHEMMVSGDCIRDIDNQVVMSRLGDGLGSLPRNALATFYSMEYQARYPWAG